MLPQVVSHYRILGKLGAGGMGEVFLAEDTDLERKVAIKVLPAKSTGDSGARRRLIREARAAAALDHPNICPVYEVNQEGDSAFIVMQYVEGETLSSRIKDGRLGLEEAVDIAAQVADALAEAHSHGIIHRDIKPQNVIVTPRGTAKVLDFGLAKTLEQPGVWDPDAQTLSLSTQPGTVFGTLHYMSPEQVRAQAVDGRTDLFSLGALLYESVTGTLPFRGSSDLEIAAEVIHTEPRPASQLNPRVSPVLECIISKALAKAADARYQSAGEMLSDLRKLSGHLGEDPRTEPAVVTTEPQQRVTTDLSARLRRKPLVFAGLLVLALAVFLAARSARYYLRTGPHQPSAEARRFYNVGTEDLGNAAYYQASKALEHSIELDDKYALAHARLAEAYTEIDQTEKAKDEILVATSLVPDSKADPQPDGMYLEAISATVRRDFPAAIAQYSKILGQAPAPEKPAVYLDLARSYDKNEKIDEAIKTYLQVAGMAPESPAAFLQLGILYGRQQNLEAANEAFGKAEQLYRAITNQEGVTEVLYQRGSLLNKLDKLAEARAQLEQALDQARVADSKYQTIKIMLQLSSVSVGVGDTAEAGRLATQAIESAQSNNVRHLAADGLIDLGHSYNFRGEYEQAQKYYKQALDFARADKASRSEARALVALGGLSINQDDSDAAKQYAEQALAFYQPAGYRKETSQALMLLGRASRQKGEYDAALQIFEQQLTLAQELGDPSQVAYSHSSIGLLLGFDQERYQEGIAHLDESYKIHMSLGAKPSVGNDLMNRGRLLWQLGRYNEAKTDLDQAFSIATAADASSHQLLAWVYLANAQMALSQRRLPEAGKAAQKALDLANRQYKEIEAQARYTLAIVYALSGRAVAGKALCEDAARLVRDKANPRILSHALLALAEVALGTADPQSALKLALEAEERFARSGEHDSEWRAWLMAARASEAAGDKRAMKEYAARAESVLSSLQEKWGVEGYKTYTARPDIHMLSKQVSDLVTAIK